MGCTISLPDGADGDFLEQLKRDFYNSLLAAYTLDEVKDQLKKNHFLKCHVDQITDRHFIVFGSMFA